MTDILADLAAIGRAAAVWDTQSEELQGADTSLASGDASELGPVVQPAAAAFLKHWTTRTTHLSTAAENYAVALRSAAADLGSADQGAVERIQGLLPAGSPSLTGPTGSGR